MIRNLLAKVEAQDANLEALHDAKIAQDAKIAKLEALLLGAPRVPQGKKTLRGRGLREDDATVGFAATLTLPDFATTKEEEAADDEIAQLGVASVLKTLILEMNPVFKCLKYDKDSQTCTLGGEDTNTVDIIAEDDIDINSGSGSVIDIDSGIDINANENVILRAGASDEANEGGDIVLDAQAQCPTCPTRGGKVRVRADDDIDLTAGVDSGGDINLEAKSDSGTNSSGGNVAVNTNGDGDFTVDGSTVLP